MYFIGWFPDWNKVCSKNYYMNPNRPSLWSEVKNLSFQTTSELDTAEYEGRGEKCSVKWPKKAWRDETWSQLQLTGVHHRSDQQLPHPDPSAAPAQQIDEKGLSSVQTTAGLEPSGRMSLGTPTPRVTQGPSLCPGLNLMYDPKVFFLFFFFSNVGYKHKSLSSTTVPISACLCVHVCVLHTPQSTWAIVFMMLLHWIFLQINMKYFYSFIY